MSKYVRKKVVYKLQEDGTFEKEPGFSTLLVSPDWESQITCLFRPPSTYDLLTSVGKRPVEQKHTVSVKDFLYLTFSDSRKKLLCQVYISLSKPNLMFDTPQNNRSTIFI